MKYSTCPQTLASPNLEQTETPSRFAVKLRLSISTLFLCLMLPSFALFVLYVYQTNYEIYKRNAVELITSHNVQTSAKLFALLDPIGDSLLTLAKQVRDEPRLFDSSSFHDTMLLHLENNPDLVSVFVASDKGSFHQVQRISEGMVVANRVPSADVKFNTWVVRSTGPQQGARCPSVSRLSASVFTFYKDRDTVLDTFTVNNNYDARERPFYKALACSVGTSANIERERFVYIGEPYIASSTGQTTINVSAPIFLGKIFSGMVGESFELSTISNFLKSIQISKNCETYVLDTEGNIVVSTGPNSGYKLEKNALVKQNILEAVGQTAELAFQIRHSSSQRQFEFKNPVTSEVYLAQFTPFPNSFNKNWEVLTLAPMGDFLVGLNAINRQLIVYGGLACVFLVLLTYILSRTISRPIETLTDDIRDLLDFNRAKPVVRSNILGDQVSK